MLLPLTAERTGQVSPLSSAGRVGVKAHTAWMGTGAGITSPRAAAAHPQPPAWLSWEEAWKAKLKNQLPAGATSPGKLLDRHRLIHPKHSNGTLSFLYHLATWICGGKSCPLSISLGVRNCILLAELVQRSYAAVHVWQLAGSKAPQGIWGARGLEVPLETGKKK